MQDLAPIVLFVYNRPEQTLQTLRALSENELADQSTLYVYADGPKENATAEQKKLIEEVRTLVESKPWCKEIIVKRSARNKGLANSVIEGVTEVVNRHGKVIVLEDDILTSKYFLRFLNDGLTVYEKFHHVYAINSYMFPIDTNEVDTFLSPLATSTWGWATWADRWSAFEVNPRYKKEIQQNPFLRARFNLADYNYADMLNNSNSWGIRWYYSVFVRNGVGLFPTKSLSLNIGFGEQATHTRTEVAQLQIHEEKIEVKFSDQVNWEMQEKLIHYFSLKKKKKKGSSILVKKLKHLFS